MAEGETQYNIPVSSKQLIVYFVFLVIALSAAFLAGVMVGRNVDSSPEPTVRDIQDERLPEEAAASPTPDALTYGSTLQGDKIQGLSSSPLPVAAAKGTPSPAPAPATPAPARPIVDAKPPLKPAVKATATPNATPKATPKATPNTTPKATPNPAPKATVKPSAKPVTPEPKSAGKSASPAPLNRLTIQVGAFKERSAAEAIVKRLKGKGYSAYLVPVSEGLFNVRVGSFTDREDAERILAKLETQEKFKPFIVKP